QLKGCANTVGIYYKVSSNTTTSVPGTGVVLTNILTSNAARGVGVLINEEFPSNPGGHGEPIINDPTPIYAPLRTVGTSENIDLPFNAYFMEYTSDIAAGNFKAVATFSIEYL
ncbi:fimbrial protein, partial [Enterobacter hormaechei]